MTSTSLNTEIRLLQLEQDNAAMRADNAALRAQFQMEREQNHRERWRLRVQAGLAFVALVCAVFLSPANRQAIAQGYGITLASLNARLTAVEGKTQYVSIGSDGEMYVKGTNLHIENGLPNPGVSGSGVPVATTLNGKGNLIIGFNRRRSGDYGTDNNRTGSHNLIVGDFNNSSSYGGIVAGFENTISGPYASVNGGLFNISSGYYSSVGGGGGNYAFGNFASVSGGYSRTAFGDYDWVGGGLFQDN